MPDTERQSNVIGVWQKLKLKTAIMESLFGDLQEVGDFCSRVTVQDKTTCPNKKTQFKGSKCNNITVKRQGLQHFCRIYFVCCRFNGGYHKGRVVSGMEKTVTLV